MFVQHFLRRLLEDLMAEEGKEHPKVNEENQNIHLNKNFISLHLFSNKRKTVALKNNNRCC